MANRYIPDVKVHHTAGCELCGRTDAHTHTQSDWNAHVAGDFAGGASYPPPPAADPYVPPKRTPPTTRTTGSPGATAMSKATEARDLLNSAGEKLDELAPAVHSDGEAEELGQLQQAQQTEEEAKQAPTDLAMAETAMQAEQLRQQAKAGLEARVANAGQNMTSAEEMQKQIREAVEGTTRGDEMVATAGSIHDAIEETKTSLAQAAEIARQKEQTGECIGLIQKAGEYAETAAKLCHSLKADTEQYVGGL